MATTKFVFDAHSTDSFGRAAPNWVLCIGAGINHPVLPDWDTLVRDLVERIFGPTSISAYEDMQATKAWSADSWVQVCLNKVLGSGGNVQDFRRLLAETIYRPMFHSRTAKEIEILLKGFSRLNRLSRKEFFQFADILVGKFERTTAYQLAEILCDRRYAQKMPSAILNFNADIILECLVLVLNKRTLAERNKNFDDPPMILNRISNRVAAQNYFRMFEDRIPLYHIHGCLFPFDEQIVNKAQQVSDLVFEENSYADMTQAAYNWGQTIFLSLCQERQMVFLGLSMKDANIRRWLIYSQTQDNDTVETIASSQAFTGRHIWIDRASNKTDLSLLDFMTRHLGVKVATIPHWDGVGLALKNLAGIR